MTPARRTRWSWTALAWALLPVAAWFVATLWFGGEVGRGTDDYSVSLRDPATGELPSPFNPWVRYPFFWRPLHVAMCFGLGTVFSEHWRVLMVFCAVMHGAACLGVYALLRAGTRSRGPAAVGALALLVHPMNFEVAFWFCSISAAIATMLWCGLMLWCVRLVKRASRPRLLELLGVGALALAIPCFYEQPATGVLAMPLVLLAAWLASTGGPTLVPAAIRAIVLCFIAGCMNIVYIVLLRLTAPETFRGGSGSFVSGDRLGARIGDVARSARWQLEGPRIRQVTTGAWQAGLDALATPVGIAVLAMLALLVIAWAWAWWGEESPAQDGPARPARPRLVLSRVCWLAAGSVLFCGAFVPIALMARQNVEARTLYFPLVGLCLIVAHAVDALLGCVPASGRLHTVRRAASALLALAAGAGVLAGVVVCVGIQAWCHGRAKRDEHIAAQLAELVPNPPPNTVYVPLKLDAGPTSSGLPMFDRLRPAAFATTWSATALMQQATRRRDVLAASINPYATYPYDLFNAEGLRFAVKLDGRAVSPGGKEVIAWSRAVPFVVEDDGRVRLVRQLNVERPDERVETFTPPIVRAAVRSGAARGHAATFSVRDAADPPPAFVEGWSWCDPPAHTPREAVQMKPLTSRGTKREGVWLHPTYQNASVAAMCTAVPPADHERRLVFRLTTPPEDYIRFAGAGPVTLHVEVFAGGETQAPIASTQIEFTRELAERETRWAPLELAVPASSEPLTLIVRVQGSKTRGATHAPLWITPGLWVQREPEPAATSGR